MPLRPPLHRGAGFASAANRRREFDRRRGSSRERGYTIAWQKARAAYLAQHPLCVFCEREGVVTAAVVIDHVVAHQGDHDRFWDPENWQSLCKRHHDSTKQREEKNRREGVGASKSPRSLDRDRCRSQIIWDKTRLVISRGDYHWQHEPAWYAVRKGKTGHWAGDRKQTTVWEIPHAKSDTGHGTQKPVECMKRPIENNSSAGQAVYEPFSGSGTTIIAAEMTGRACHAIELNPGYVDVAIHRWQAFTGGQATLDGTLETFAAVAEMRCPASTEPGVENARP